MQLFHQRVVRPRLQAGVSNLQIMIGTLIGGILIMGGIAMIGQIDKAKVDNEIQEVTRLKKKTVALGAQRGSLAGVTQEALIQLDFFRAETLAGPVGSRTINNQWGGRVQVAPVSILSPNDGFWFYYSGMPAKACKQFAIQLADIASNIWIDGVYVKQISVPAGQPRVNLPTLIAACERRGDNVGVEFHLLK